MEIAQSVNRVPIRLTEERWSHIVNSHEDLAGYFGDVLYTIEEPEWVLRGQGGTLDAVRSYGANRYLVVAYRELSKHDGFVITAYFASRINRRNVLWRR